MIKCLSLCMPLICSWSMHWSFPFWLAVFLTIHFGFTSSNFLSGCTLFLKRMQQKKEPFNHQHQWKQWLILQLLDWKNLLRWDRNHFFTLYNESFTGSKSQRGRRPVKLLLGEAAHCMGDTKRKTVCFLHVLKRRVKFSAWIGCRGAGGGFAPGCHHPWHSGRPTSTCPSTERRAKIKPPRRSCYRVFGDYRRTEC